jgi:hypothetical protein
MSHFTSFLNIHFNNIPCMLHVPSISSTFILSFQYVAKRTNNEAPHHAVLYVLQLSSLRSKYPQHTVLQRSKMSRKLLTLVTERQVLKSPTLDVLDLTPAVNLAKVFVTSHTFQRSSCNGSTNSYVTQKYFARLHVLLLSALLKYW